MKHKRLFAAILLVFCLGGMATLVAEDESSKETYDGEPVYHLGDGVTPPRATCRPNPEYDDKDRKKKVNGTVVLSVIVTKAGQTADIKVTKSLTAGLDQQAIKAVSQWRFEPATRNGEPVAVRVEIETTFRLY